MHGAKSPQWYNARTTAMERSAKCENLHFSRKLILTASCLYCIISTRIKVNINQSIATNESMAAEVIFYTIMCVVFVGYIVVMHFIKRNDQRENTR